MVTAFATEREAERHATRGGRDGGLSSGGSLDGGDRWTGFRVRSTESARRDYFCDISGDGYVLVCTAHVRDARCGYESRTAMMGAELQVESVGDRRAHAAILNGIAGRCAQVEERRGFRGPSPEGVTRWAAVVDAYFSAGNVASPYGSEDDARRIMAWAANASE